ncbi:hypothetical protein FOZ62_022772, partial [Perkinsus olseni]
MSTATVVQRSERPYVSVLLLLILALQFYNPVRHYPECRCLCGESRVSPSVPSPPSAAVPPASSSDSRARDALNDLAAVRRAAEEQHARLKEAGRLPAETEISQRAQKLLEDYRRSVDSSPPPPPPPPPPVYSETPVSANTYRPRNAVPPLQPIPYDADSLKAQPRTPSPSQATGPYEQLGDGPIKFTADFGAVLQQAQGQGIGVILGVGRGEFALQLLKTWPASAGIYLCDPYIHIWQGYKDPDNHSDRDHQLIFEDLRNRLVPYEGKYVLIRDFSYSFGDTYRSEPNQPPPTFIYIDANHAYAAVKQDLEQWWPMLATGGLIAGSTFIDDDQRSIGVATAVREFATTVQRPISMDLSSSSSSSFPPGPASVHNRGVADRAPFHAQAVRESAEEAVPRWEAPRLAHRYARLRSSVSSSVRSAGLDPTDHEAPRSSVESLPSSVGCAPRYARHRRPPPLTINRRTDHSDDDAYGSNAISSLEASSGLGGRLLSSRSSFVMGDDSIEFGDTVVVEAPLDEPPAYIVSEDGTAASLQNNADAAVKHRPLLPYLACSNDKEAPSDSRGLSATLLRNDELTESRMDFLTEEMRSLRAQVELVQNRLYEDASSASILEPSGSSDETPPPDTADAGTQCSPLVGEASTFTDAPVTTASSVMTDSRPAMVSTEVQTEATVSIAPLEEEEELQRRAEQREAVAVEVASLECERDTLEEEIGKLTAEVSKQRKLIKTQSTAQSITEALRHNGEVRAYHTANMRLRKQVLQLRNEIDSQRQVVCEAAS